MQIRKVEGMRFKVKDAVTLYCVVKCNDETWKSGHATAKGGKDHLFNVRGSRASRVWRSTSAPDVAAAAMALAAHALLLLLLLLLPMLPMLLPGLGAVATLFLPRQSLHQRLHFPGTASVLRVVLADLSLDYHVQPALHYTGLYRLIYDESSPMMSRHTACNRARVRALPWPQFKNVKEFYDVRFDMDVNVTVSCVKERFGRGGCARAR